MTDAARLIATPIGRLRTPWHTTSECPRNGRRGDMPLCTVELDAAYIPGLKDIEGYTHLILLYWLNQSGPPEMVFTPPNDTEPRGTFATLARGLPMHAVGDPVMRVGRCNRQAYGAQIQLHRAAATQGRRQKLSRLIDHTMRLFEAQKGLVVQHLAFAVGDGVEDMAEVAVVQR